MRTKLYNNIQNILIINNTNAKNLNCRIILFSSFANSKRHIY